jgi:hypothetical protein
LREWYYPPCYGLFYTGYSDFKLVMIIDDSDSVSRSYGLQGPRLLACHLTKAVSFGACKCPSSPQWPTCRLVASLVSTRCAHARNRLGPPGLIRTSLNGTKSHPQPMHAHVTWWHQHLEHAPAHVASSCGGADCMLAPMSCRFTTPCMVRAQPCHLPRPPMPRARRLWHPQLRQ